jgi:S-disulfanyl-L-cysteine oxidoreductase SoxD
VNAPVGNGLAGVAELVNVNDWAADYAKFAECVHLGTWNDGMNGMTAGDKIRCSDYFNDDIRNMDMGGMGDCRRATSPRQSRPHNPPIISVAVAFVVAVAVADVVSVTPCTPCPPARSLDPHRFRVLRGPKLFATAIALLLTLTHHTEAQTKKTASKTKKPAPYTGPSTLSGIYTDEQATRGKDVYFGSCRSCHSPQSHTGATFATWWKGKQLSDLYGFVHTRMPKNDPGSLSAEDAADVVAYLLKMNAMPVGPNELYPDADSLKQFRIETKRSAATSTAKRAKP